MLGSKAKESGSPAEYQMKEIICKVYMDQAEQHIVADIKARDEAQKTQQQVDDAHPLQVEPRPPRVSGDDS